MIAGTKEFFIAVSNHPEWGEFSVWGTVSPLSFQTIDKILLQPYDNVTHPQYGTKMRILKKEITFDLAIARASLR